MTALDDTRHWLHDEVPPLRFSDAQIQEFLDMAKVPDSLGYKPMSPSYTPTYDVLKAAGYGWLWLAGCVGNTSQYTTGDLSVTYDVDYCRNRARELMASSTATSTRRDEPSYERWREIAYDGDNPRHR